MKKNRSVHAVIFTSIVFMFSAVAFAAGAATVTEGFGTMGEIITSFTKNIVSTLGTLFATAAMVAFFYGIVQYIWGVRDGKPDKVIAGNKFMISGLVALFVMFSVWGIVTYTQDIFGIKGQNTITIPKINIEGGTTNGANPGTNPGTNPGNNNGGLPAAQGQCSNKAPGSLCTLPSGQTGSCDVNADGVVGCYAIPGAKTCPAGQFLDSNGTCAVPAGGGV